MNSLLKGVVAGIAGTGIMTAYQLGVAKVRGQGLAVGVPHRWEDAPAPARVAKLGADAVGRGRIFTREDVPLLTNALHWLYGIGWGTFYGLGAGHASPDPVTGGLAFGTGVWCAAYAELIPLGIYEPPWKSPKQELALDVSYHLVYGLAVAAAYAALDSR